MPKGRKDIEAIPVPEPQKPKFAHLLTLAQVKDILNVGMPTLYALLSSGELRAIQVGGRGYLGNFPVEAELCPGILGEGPDGHE